MSAISFAIRLFRLEEAIIGVYRVGTKVDGRRRKQAGRLVGGRQQVAVAVDLELGSA
jgi:ABC-type branched-subunit amino acid transport system ATPase component